MELTNQFVVPVSVAEAWAVLTDVEKIAPCMPGAELKEVEGDEYRGLVKVKVGPITASYKGVARFLELDVAGHRAVLKAEGRETRGQGNATATITAVLTAEGDGTKVDVSTDLAITGKVAQFGRGVLAEVSGKLLDQFVRNLETTVLTPGGGAGPASPDSETGEAQPGSAPANATPGDNGSAGAPPGSGAGRASSPRRSRGSAGKAEATGEGGAEATGDGGAEATGDAGAEATGDGGAEATGDGGAEATGEPDAADASVAAGTSDDAPAPPSGPRQINSPPAEPVDLMGVAGPSLGKRLIPFASVAGALFLLRIVIYALRRRKS